MASQNWKRTAGKRTPEQQHRREVLLTIMLPMIGVLLIMALVIILVIMAASPVQFSLISDFMLTIFCIIPIMLTCLVPTLLLLAASIGLWHLNTVAARPLRRGRKAALRQLEKARQLTPRAAAPVVKMQSTLNYWEHIVTRRSSKGDSAPNEEQTYGS